MTKYSIYLSLVIFTLAVFGGYITPTLFKNQPVRLDKSILLLHQRTDFALHQAHFTGKSALTEQQVASMTRIAAQLYKVNLDCYDRDVRLKHKFDVSRQSDNK